MAIYSWSMAIVKRSEGRSVVAAAAYYAREKLTDHRTGKTHDYRDRTDLEHQEILLPPNAPAWCQGIERETLWGLCEQREVRRDAQLARSVRIMIPREFSKDDRIRVVKDYLNECFTKRGMIVDACWHNPPARSGGQNPHCHALITMRHLSEEGFGPKSRHTMVPDPSGKTHPDGRPILVPSNKDSWNTPEYFESCRERWEIAANKRLSEIGSEERIDRRSLLARGLARMPEPALRLAAHLAELRGSLKIRMGHFQMAKHYQSVERRAKAVFQIESDPAAALLERAQARAAAPRRDETPVARINRFTAWIDRQLARLPIGPSDRGLGDEFGQPVPQRAAATRPPPGYDMER